MNPMIATSLKKKRNRLRFDATKAMLLVAGMLVVATAFAQDRADIDRTQIIGNRELPKVLIIVPWKKPAPGDLAGRPLVSVLDEALAPVDRDVFRREVRYDALTRTVPSPTPAK